MEQHYNHFSTCEDIARRLKSISHTDTVPRYFSAFGIEDLYNLDDKLSSVNGTILIAVDGCESDSTDNGYDTITEHRTYSIIIASHTVADRPATITQAAEHSRAIAKQIRNYLFSNKEMKGIIDRSTQLTGIGPIGDSFYGVVLTYSIIEPDNLLTDSTLFNI